MASFARAVVLTGLLLCPLRAAASTYIVPSDYGVACIELATGKVLWRRPGKLTRPRLRIQGKVLVAEDSGTAAGRVRVELDPATGKPSRVKVAAAPVVEQVPTLAVNRRTAKGQTLAFDPGNTRHVETESGQVLVVVDWFPDNVLVQGDLVILNMSDGKGGSEVYGWDLAAGALAWEIDLVDHLPGLPDGAYAAIGLDGDRLFVSVDQRMLAFELGSRPRLLWKSDLPRQPIREYDVPWVRFARHGEVLFAEVYEDLIALRVSDGVVLWRFDAGMLGQPWPLVHGGRVYVSYRDGEVDPSSISIAGRRQLPVSALIVKRGAKRWTLTPTSRGALPAGGPVWSQLHQPPRRARARTRTILEIEDSDGEKLVIDLTAAGATSHVKFHGLYRRATLRGGKRTVATASW